MRCKKFLSIILSILLSLTMLACNNVSKVDASAAVNVEKEVKYSFGNEFGNIAKGGNLAYKDDDIYYSFLGTLYKKNIKTNEINKISENGYAISYINLINDGIYSIDLGTDNETYIMYRSLDGKENKILSKEDARELVVDSKYIYYVGVKEQTNSAVIKRMNLDGSNKCIFYEPENPVKFNDFKDKITMVNNYVILQYADKYKVIDTKTQKSKEYPMKYSYMILDYALKDNDLYINVAPIYDYFPNFPFKPVLRKINLSDNKDEILNTETIYFQILDDGIYYFTIAQIGETDGLYKIDSNGKNRSLINKTENRLAYKANNKMYYIVNKNVPDVVEVINK